MVDCVRDHARVVPPHGAAGGRIGPRGHDDLRGVAESVGPETPAIDRLDDRPETRGKLDVAMVRHEVGNPAFRGHVARVVGGEWRRGVRMDDVGREVSKAPAHPRRNRGSEDDGPRPHADDAETIDRLLHGKAGSCRVVMTVTSWPRRASSRERVRTWLSTPPK